MYKVLAVLLLVASVSFGAFTPPDAGVAIGNEAVTNTYNGVLNTNAVVDLITSNAILNAGTTNSPVITVPEGSTVTIGGLTIAEDAAVAQYLQVVNVGSVSTDVPNLGYTNGKYVPFTGTNAIITKAVSTAGTAAAAAYTPIIPSEREFSNGWKIETSGTNLIFTYTAP